MCSMFVERTINCFPSKFRIVVTNIKIYARPLNGQGGPVGEVFTSLMGAKILIERWREHFYTIRPHSKLDNRPPIPQTIYPPEAWSTTLCRPLAGSESALGSRLALLQLSGQVSKSLPK